MGIGESIKKGFGSAKKSMPIVGIFFVFSVVFSLINLFLNPQAAVTGTAAATPAPPPPPGILVAGIVFLFLSIFLQAGLMGYIRDLIKTGAASMAAFNSSGRKYYLRMLALGLIVSLVIGVFVLLAALSVALLVGNLAALGVVLAIFFGALGIYFVVLLFLCPYAAVIDEKGVGASIRLSMKLVKKNILPLLGITILLVLIGFGIGLVLGVILAGVSLLIKTGMTAQVIFAVLSSFVNSYLGIVVTGAFTHFYLSLPDRNNT